MTERIEPWLRGWLAARVGVSPAALLPAADLVRDLGVPADRVFGVCLEAAHARGLELADHVVEAIHTYGDLLDALVHATLARGVPEERAPAEPVWVWCSALARAGAARVERSGWLTSYLAETIADDVARGGTGATLGIAVPAETSDETVVRVGRRFAPLAARGVSVEVNRRDPRRAPGTRPAAA